MRPGRLARRGLRRVFRRLTALSTALSAILLELVLPWRCAACGASDPAAPESGLCRDCRAQLRDPSPGLCPRCGELIGPAARGRPRCRQCRRRPFLGRTTTLFCYDRAGRDLVRALKYDDRPRLAERWGRRLGVRLRARPPAARPDIVTAVPMHAERRRRRGFNQAERVARAVAAELDCPFRPLLRRTRHTPPLFRLGRERRREVLEDAFAASGPLPVGARVLLVDDVRTTGETLNRCAALIGRGTGRPVDLAVLAVALDQEFGSGGPPGFAAILEPDILEPDILEPDILDPDILDVSCDTDDPEAEGPAPGLADAAPDRPGGEAFSPAGEESS